MQLARIIIFTFLTKDKSLCIKQRTLEDVSDAAQTLRVDQCLNGKTLTLTRVGQCLNRRTLSLNPNPR